MADWFNYKGIRSTDLGVHVMEFPPLSFPEERVEFQQVLGRSGSLTQLEGEGVYNDVLLSISCFVEDLTRVDRIATWLRGSGVLILGNMPDRYYLARPVNQLDLRKILRNHDHRVFSPIFRCAPYRYQNPAITPFSLTNGVKITNPGNVKSEPKYIVSGRGILQVVVGDKEININNYGIVSGLVVTAHSTPDMAVSISTGVAWMTDGTQYAPSDIASQAVSAANSTNPRFDILYLSSEGIIAYLAGTAAATPVAPEVPSGGLLLATIRVAANQTTIKTENIVNSKKPTPAESVTIDTALGLVYKTDSDPLVSLTSLVVGTDWPFTIDPGDNDVSLGGTGTIYSVIIDPRWRYV